MTTLRDVLTVQVAFPHHDFSERLACEPIALNLVKLLEFSNILALAPGDLITTDDAGKAVSVEPADGWLVEAHFRKGTEEAVVDHITEAWSRSTAVARPADSMLTARALTTSKQWIDDIIETNPLIEWVEVLREPGSIPLLHDPDDPGTP